jgi:hypothetical protein
MLYAGDLPAHFNQPLSLQVLVLLMLRFVAGLTTREIASALDCRSRGAFTELDVDVRANDQAGWGEYICDLTTGSLARCRPTITAGRRLHCHCSAFAAAARASMKRTRELRGYLTFGVNPAACSRLTYGIVLSSTSFQGHG